MSKFIVYFDMDGVLANFERRWTELYGEPPQHTRAVKRFSSKWENFVLSRQFESLDFFPGAHEVYNFVRDSGRALSIQILSSSGGEIFYDEVREQKINWLRNSRMQFAEVNIVPGRRLKKNYATANSILIDDTPDVIEDFNNAGGIGILHRDSQETISILKEIFQNESN
jgi:phosphoglycolate phosphatase-like HAD superfamily hydrolase